MQQMTSANQPVTELDRPDIVAARIAEAQARVNAALEPVTNGDKQRG
jgi:hypothetical protein